MLSGSLPAENFCLACLSDFLLECPVGESETKSGEMGQPGSYLKPDLGTSEAAPSSAHLGFSQVQARLVRSRAAVVIVIRVGQLRLVAMQGQPNQSRQTFLQTFFSSLIDVLLWVMWFILGVLKGFHELLHFACIFIPGHVKHGFF